MPASDHPFVFEWLAQLQSGLDSLVILGVDAHAMDQVALLLRQAWLSDLTQTLDEFDASNYDQIMGHLNRLLSLKANDSAKPLQAFSAPLNLWIIRNTQLLSPEQLHLLGQMLVLNPGLNLRWILLHVSDATPQAWIDATRNATQTHRCPDLSTSIPDSAKLAQEPIFDPFAWPASSPQDPAPILASRAKVQTRSSGWLSHLLIGTLFLGIGWGVGRWSAPQKVETEVIIESTPAAAASSLAMAGADPLKPAHPTPAASEPTPAPASTQPAANETALQTENTKASARSDDQALLTNLKADMQWLNELSSEHHVIAHGTFRKLDNAKAFKEARPELSKARIVPLWVNKRMAFAVVTGPFRSEARAENNLSKLKWSANAKIMSVPQAQKLMQAAVKSTAD